MPNEDALTRQVDELRAENERLRKELARSKERIATGGNGH